MVCDLNGQYKSRLGTYFSNESTVQGLKFGIGEVAQCFVLVIFCRVQTIRWQILIEVCDFIPLAENSGVIDQITASMISNMQLNKVCKVSNLIKPYTE